MKSVPKRGSVGSDKQLRLVNGIADPTLPRFRTDFMTLRKEQPPWLLNPQYTASDTVSASALLLANSRLS